MAIITGGQLVNAATGPVGLPLIMSGYENKATLSLGIGSAINLVLNVALIHILELEVNGAAAAFAESLATIMLLYLYFVLRILQIKPSGSGGAV